MLKFETREDGRQKKVFLNEQEIGYIDVHEGLFLHTDKPVGLNVDDLHALIGEIREFCRRPYNHHETARRFEILFPGTSTGEYA